MLISAVIHLKLDNDCITDPNCIDNLFNIYLIDNVDTTKENKPFNDFSFHTFDHTSDGKYFGIETYFKYTPENKITRL